MYLQIVLLLFNIFHRIDSHGYISQPSATYINQINKTSYITRVDGNKIFSGLKWDDTPENNANQLSKNIYQDVRQII
jgi:hypothetical protein